MKYQFMKCVIFLFLINGFAEPYGSVEINRHGRRIQLDGFLMEWSSKSANQWDSTGLWYWDAINTPEGIAGYIRSEKAITCSSWTFVIETSGNAKSIIMKVPSDQSSGNDYYKLDSELLKDSSKVALEFIVSWNNADLDTSKRYALDLKGQSYCGEILPSLIINGSKEPPKGIITSKIIIQAIFIVLLLALYIIVRIKIRNQTRQRRSPHPEA